MKIMLIICVGLFFLSVSYCERSQVSQSSKATPQPAQTSSGKTDCDWKGDVLDERSTGLQKFLIGKWEGRVLPEQRVEMNLTFQEDGNVLIDYSMATSKGGIFYRPYRIKDEKTISICGYPDDFAVIKHNDNEIDLRSTSSEMRAAVALIYECNFTRVKN